MRIILFTGKGGVGKSTLASATAIKAASLGYRTLIISTDVAHSLADAFSTKLGNDPQPLGIDGLFAAELDAAVELEHYWGDIKRRVAKILKDQGLDATIAGEMAVIPGLDEILSLVRIQKVFSEAEYDLLVIDSAPTGAAMRLLSAPDLNQLYVKNILNLSRGIGRFFAPSLNFFKNLALNEPALQDRVKELFQKIEALHLILTDPDITSVRLVMNPERMAMLETERAFTFFALYGLNVDAFLVNRIIPAEVVDPYLRSWKKTQAHYCQLVKETFAPVPVFEIPLMEKEVEGLESLRSLSELVSGGADPVKRLTDEKPLQFSLDNGRYTLSLRVVGVTGKDIDLEKEGEALRVKIGKFNRSIILPQYIAGLNPASASLDNGYLHILFEE